VAFIDVYSQLYSKHRCGWQKELVWERLIASSVPVIIQHPEPGVLSEGAVPNETSFAAN